MRHTGYEYPRVKVDNVQPNKVIFVPNNFHLLTIRTGRSNLLLSQREREEGTI